MKPVDIVGDTAGDVVDGSPPFPGKVAEDDNEVIPFQNNELGDCRSRAMEADDTPISLQPLGDPFHELDQYLVDKILMGVGAFRVAFLLDRDGQDEV